MWTIESPLSGRGLRGSTKTNVADKIRVQHHKLVTVHLSEWYFFPKRIGIGLGLGLGFELGLGLGLGLRLGLMLGLASNFGICTTTFQTNDPSDK